MLMLTLGLVQEKPLKRQACTNRFAHTKCTAATEHNLSLSSIGYVWENFCEAIYVLLVYRLIEKILFPSWHLKDFTLIYNLQVHHVNNQTY